MRLISSMTVAALTALAACAPTETLFQSNFNSTPVGDGPAAAQAVGTASNFGPPGSVVIAGPLSGETDNWIHISRANNEAQVAGMTGTLSAFKPPGTYHFAAAMYVPSKAGRATVEFDAFNPNPSNGERFELMHLDFLPTNKVEIDDQPATDFGAFPRDAPFDLFVTLNTSASPPTATIGLVGAGASGSTTNTVLYPNAAQQFDSFTLWMGTPWTGSFQATALTVTRDTP